MSPEPIRDYVGEALAQFANGKATFDTNSGVDDAMSPRNQAGFNGGGFQSKFGAAAMRNAVANSGSSSRRPVNRDGKWAPLQRSNYKQ
jgi:hypothetical protein